MKFTTTMARIYPPNKTKEFQLVVSVPPSDQVDKINKICKQDKPISVEIKVKRDKRSLDANAYYWQLTHQLAKALGTTDQELHELLLERYGTHDYLIVTSEAIESMRRAFKLVEVIDNRMVGDKPGVLIKCTRGSSTYDTKEFSDLVNGLVSECKEVGIETMTPNQIAEMMAIYQPSN